ncbi:C4-dicarboxylate TRAP transporter substrate-binding protein [Xanthobacter sp. KR7-225]|uniref:C4-dicarboxylate TRAP transporter substrate-binding protein n=1 Tax=Xanthobacter sp. KR7-225 TaxID=3156613 RepID=UPI0032B5E4C8
MKRFVFALTAGLALAAAGALPSGAARADTIKLTLSTGQAPVFPYIGLIRDFAIPEIDRRLAAEGKHKIEWNQAYAGTLVKVGGELDAVSSGLTDMAVVLFTAHLSKLPLHAVTYFAPFATTDARQAIRAFNETQQGVKEFGGVWARNNQVYLGTISVEAFNLYSKKPVRSIADLKGLKVGAIGPNIHWFRDTGAAGVTFNLANIYNDMQSGVFDAAVLADSVAAAVRLGEVAPYRTQIDYGPMVFAGITINKQRWDRLPEQVRKVFGEVFQDYQDKVVELLSARARDGVAEMIAKGMTNIALTTAERRAWADAMPNIAADWAKDLEARHLPAKQVIQTYLGKLRAVGSDPLRDWSNF